MPVLKTSILPLDKEEQRDLTENLSHFGFSQTILFLTNCLCLQSPKKLPPPHLVPSLGSVLQNGNSNDSPSLPAPSLQLPMLLWWWLWKMPSELQWLVTTTSILLHLPHACNSNIPRRNQVKIGKTFSKVDPNSRLCLTIRETLHYSIHFLNKMIHVKK